MIMINTFMILIFHKEKCYKEYIQSNCSTVSHSIASEFNLNVGVLKIGGNVVTCRAASRLTVSRRAT